MSAAPLRQPPAGVQVRLTEPRDFPGIIDLCRAVYPTTPPWSEAQLASHLRVFPRGQLVAVEGGGRIAGMAASLVVLWDDYEVDNSWRDFTAGGHFTNHDPAGHTLYGAEVMVHPELQGRGIGHLLYDARERLVDELGLWRIRAGARLRGYHRHLELPAARYVEEVAAGRLRDPTLSFQLRWGFQVLGVVESYLRSDPESLGWAALIEWRPPATRRD